MTRRTIFSALALLALVLTCLPGTVLAQAEEQQRLERLQADLNELERSLGRQIERRADGMADLRRIELMLVETEQELRGLALSIEAQARRQREIAADQNAANERLDGERAALAVQVRTSYMAGPQEFMKLLLSQESPADVGRMLRYYDYLNRYRSERIAVVEAERRRLAELAAESDAVRAELERLNGEQQDRALRLASEQAERAVLVADLDRAIESSGGRVEQMRAQEAELTQLITRLAEIREGFPVNSDEPFEAHRGNLRWPVDGPMAARFGDKRDDDGLMRWDAVLIEAPAGAAVRAVYHGRVMFADWSSQMGLTVIIDHGGEYWSVYGHNGAVLRQQNDWVQAGDIIAEVGNTGGRPDPALYFSIVKDIEPLDPADWIK